MAAEALGNTLDQLKKYRMVAKTSLTKQANYLSRKAGYLTELELRQEFAKLSADSRKVIEANDDYRTGLEAELAAKEDGKDGVLSLEQDADLSKYGSECEQKFNDVKQIVQTNLWSRYGSEMLEAAFEEAEKACRHTYGLPVESSYCEGFEIQHNVVGKLIKETSDAFAAWESWIPAAEERDFRKRSRELRVAYNELDMRKGEFARARRISVEKQGTGVKQEHTGPTIPVVRIKPTKLPTFSGCKRDFHRWRTDWESLQKQGEPTGSPEVKKIQLLDSVEEKIVKDLRLSTYSTADDVFRVLANRYGNKCAIALEIVDELEKIQPVRGNQPRKVVDLIQTIGKALADLTDLGSTGAIKNPLVVRSLESKLPEGLKKDWLMFMVDPSNDVTEDKHFDMLLAFLKKQEEIFERLEHLQITDKPESSDKAERTFNKKYASTQATKGEDAEDGCIICGDEKHKDRIFFCKKFRALKLSEKEAAVERIGACRECLGCHEYDDGCRDTYLCRNVDCKKRGSSDHHFFLCPRGNSKRRELKKPQTDDRDKKNLTEEQKRFLGELTPELAERCRKAFTNNSSNVSCPAKNQVSLLKESGLRELPVIMMLMEVTANAGQKIGALVDLASDTNYITHKAAKRLNLRSEKITLIVHGVGGMATKVATRRYLLRVRIKTSKGTERAHELICYGLKEIAKVHRAVKPEELTRFFPEVEPEELRRPEQIELLISHREGRLAPQRVKVVGDLVLWESPLGKTVGGAHPDLFEQVNMTAHESKTHFARSMRTAAIKYEEIPAEVPLMTKTVHMQDTIGEARHTAATHRDVLECKEARRVLEEDSYMDDVLTSHNNSNRLSEVTKEIEEILQAGGFSLKPWVQSTQSGRQERGVADTTTRTPSETHKTFVLPSQSAEEVVTDARDSISKLQRKAFSAVMTRGQVKRCRGVTTQDHTKAEDSVEKNDTDPTHLIVCPDASETDPEMRQGEVVLRVALSNSAFKNLLEVKRFSCLSRLVNVVAWVRQAADSWLGLKDQTPKKSKWEASPSKEEGLYEVKDEVKKRVRLKVWGIVFSCMASRAIHADIVSDMSAEGFLLAYQRFTSLRGHPSKVWSDPGTNFVGAKPALEDLYRFLENLERSGVEEKVAKNGTKWSWKIHPADSPHRNGAAKAAVRTVKRALQNVGGNGVFTWGGFQTFVYMAANMANERPVDARAQSQEDCMEYITPNSLLLGRA
ncbi:uncharacterized protein LOC116223147 [Clupea harengus]|uniref:Uncharacterized protein LOC116223147 n=1 Tax=Clupea harengus TaxID=7950 RepID=A0A6P8GCL4_CLUHA|nr:uncharacterized protein LOC116223147 [Clupea harengus]